MMHEAKRFGGGRECPACTKSKRKSHGMFATDLLTLV